MVHGTAADIPRLEPSAERRPQQPAA